MTDVHIHAPVGYTWAARFVCRRCRTTTDHLVTSFVWYGPMTTCCECGAFRNDGILARARKSDARRAAKAREALATAGDRDGEKAWIMAEIEAAS